MGFDKDVRRVSKRQGFFFFIKIKITISWEMSGGRIQGEAEELKWKEDGMMQMKQGVLGCGKMG